MSYGEGARTPLARCCSTVIDGAVTSQDLRCSVPLAQLADSIRKTGRRFLRHVVPDAKKDATVNAGTSFFALVGTFLFEVLPALAASRDGPRNFDE